MTTRTFRSASTASKAVCRASRVRAEMGFIGGSLSVTRAMGRDLNTHQLVGHSAFLRLDENWRPLTIAVIPDLRP